MAQGRKRGQRWGRPVHSVGLLIQSWGHSRVSHPPKLRASRFPRAHGLWPEASSQLEKSKDTWQEDVAARSHLPWEKVRPGSDNSEMHNPSPEGFHVVSLLPRLPGMLGRLALCFDLVNLETLRRSGWELHLLLGSILSNYLPFKRKPTPHGFLGLV